MNRIDRIAAILIHLQSKKIVKAQEVADRFQISLRTVYRDVKTLEEAGVPLIGEAGTGYSIMEGYRLPPVMFTREEATAFLTAEKLIEKFTDDATGKLYKSAMYKIKAVLRSTEKDFIDDLGDRIEVVRHINTHDLTLKNNIIPSILQSINAKHILSIQYFSGYSEKTTERNIEPIGICYISNNWHLIAFCQLRNDYRDFRIDRINKLTSTGKTFNNKHLSLKEYINQMSKNDVLIPATILFDKSIVKYLREQRYYYGFMQEIDKKEKIEMTFLTPSLDYLSHWL
ncbi:MAG TPA: YafY family protein, partial [Flavipsychrobacter sp.]|nr:YafY family protein [Flavipsychrobacter sp.]